MVSPSQFSPSEFTPAILSAVKSLTIDATGTSSSTFWDTHSMLSKVSCHELWVKRQVVCHKQEKVNIIIMTKNMQNYSIFERHALLKKDQLVSNTCQRKCIIVINYTRTFYLQRNREPPTLTIWKALLTWWDLRGQDPSHEIADLPLFTKSKLLEPKFCNYWSNNSNL